MEFDNEKFQQSLQDLTKSAIDQTLSYANSQAQKILDDTRSEINSRLQPKILSVQVGAEPLVTLKTEAVSFLPRMVTNAKLGLNTLLVGPAGSGKTFGSSQLAEALGRKFGSLCLTAGASETWLFGRQTPNGFIEGMFSKLYREGGVFLADELDAADPNLLLSINTALANGYLYNPISGEEIKKHDDFVFIGACNTFGKGGNHVYTGRNRLDAATLDRFVTIAVDYNEAVEETLCPDNEIRVTLQTARRNLKTMQSDEIISTRAIHAAYKQNQAGIELQHVFTSLTLSWSPEMAKVVFNAHRDFQKMKKSNRR